MTVSSQYVESLSRAVSLTVLELDIDCDRLIPAYLLANMMSPALWGWREERKAHSSSGRLLSVNRRLKELARHFHHYSFTRLLDSPGGDPWGLLNFSAEEARLGRDFIRQARSEYDRTLRSLLEENPDSQFGQIVQEDYYDEGYFPRLRNETVDIMNAYAALAPEGKGSGKCAALAMLWAAGLMVWAHFPTEKIAIIGNSAHIFVFLDEGDGHLFNNTKWFNKTRIQNDSDASEFAKTAATATDTRFVYCPAVGTCKCKERRSEIPEDQLTRLLSKLNSFLSTPVRCPETSEFEFVSSSLAIPSPEDHGSSQSYQDEIWGLAHDHAGSIFDFAQYSFRRLDVPHPEAYARSATRDYHTQQLATGLESLEDAVAIVQDISGRECAFGCRDRLALPDETLIFGKGDDRERALLLFALLYHSPMQAPDIALAFTQGDSYVRNSGIWINAEGRLLEAPTENRPLRMFNTETNWLSG